MHSLKDTDPHIYIEKGNWVVNKNSVPFCSIGGDHALEHLNRAMKVSGGLVGITLNENARTRFFLIAPELHCPSSQTNDLANLKSSTPTKHHTFTNVVTNRQQKYVLKLLTALNNFTNPFKYDGDDLINLVTKSVMSNVVKDDVCNHANVGKDLYQKFCETRIISNSVNLWDPMKKVKLQTFKSASKMIKVKVKDEIVELKEDRGLFARMLIVTRSRPDIDLKRCISLYELTVVPRSLFSPDGMLLLCSTKSIILKQLETFPFQRTLKMKL